MLEQQVAQAVGEVHERAAAVATARRLLGDGAGDRRADDEIDELVRTGDVAVQRHRRDAEPGGHGADRDGRQSLRVGERHGGIDDVLAADLRWPADPRARRCRGHARTLTYAYGKRHP
jgi:hypothetical protein